MKAINFPIFFAKNNTYSYVLLLTLFLDFGPFFHNRRYDVEFCLCCVLFKVSKPILAQLKSTLQKNLANL